MPLMGFNIVGLKKKSETVMQCYKYKMRCKNWVLFNRNVIHFFGGSGRIPDIWHLCYSYIYLSSSDNHPSEKLSFKELHWITKRPGEISQIKFFNPN